jgi:hypothetical protein
LGNRITDQLFKAGKHFNLLHAISKQLSQMQQCFLLAKQTDTENGFLLHPFQIVGTK